MMTGTRRGARYFLIAALLVAMVCSVCLVGYLLHVRHIWRECSSNATLSMLATGQAQPVDVEPPYNVSPLHLAALENNTTAAAGILQKGIDPNIRDVDGFTPLHWSAVYGSAETTALLLASGASPNAVSLSSLTPLHLANTTAIAEMLLNAGADITVRDRFGASPLHWAANTDMARILLSKGADPDVTCIRFHPAVKTENATLLTPLALAIAKNNPNLVCLLICVSSPANRANCIPNEKAKASVMHMVGRSNIPEEQRALEILRTL